MATARPRPQVMRLTDAAALRIKDVMARADKPVAGVRVGVKNGGCAGMEYTMEYAVDIKPTDEVVEDKGVKILVDPKAVLVPARNRDGLQDRKAVGSIHLQQSEPDQRLRLRRIGATDACEERRVSPSGHFKLLATWRRPLKLPDQFRTSRDCGHFVWRHKDMSRRVRREIARCRPCAGWRRRPRSLCGRDARR